MTPHSPVCIHRVLEGDIQEFVLTEVSRPAVAELFDSLDRLLDDAVLNSNLPVQAKPCLIDSRVGLQPLNYSLARLRATVAKLPEHHKGLIAVILPAGPLLKTLAVLIRPIISMRLYAPQERDQALVWLRKDAAAKH